MKSLLSAASIIWALALPGHAEVPKGWTNDFAAAVAQAKAERKDILIEFTDSGFDTPAKALEQEVFSSSQFEAWAPRHVVLVQVDFSVKVPLPDDLKKQNSNLSSMYHPGGTPTVVVVKPDSTAVAKQQGYLPGTGAVAYIHALEAQMKKAGSMPSGSGVSNVGAPKQPSIFKTTPIPSSLQPAAK